MKGFLLTTTSLQCTTNNSEDLLFLGEWCKDYSSLTELENKITNSLELVKKIQLKKMKQKIILILLQI